MPAPEIHIRNFKAIVMMLILAFSLSPCSLKRDLLDIFDIQYVSALNKVKTTNPVQSYTCDSETQGSSYRTTTSKSSLKSKDNKFFTALNSTPYPQKGSPVSQNNYSGHSTGNNPPKYILFKRLKLHLA